MIIYDYIIYYLNLDSKIKKEIRYTDDFETFKKKLADKEMKIESIPNLISEPLANPLHDNIICGPSNCDWDQFELNKEKFKVDSTYDENKYTTDLNREEITDERIREAEIIEKVIYNYNRLNLLIIK